MEEKARDTIDHKEASAEDPEVKISSGNIWADIGRQDAATHFAKVKVLYRIQEAVKEKGISQRKVAKLLGLDPSRLSDLMRGRVVGYTLDRMLFYLMLLGHDVEILIRPHEDPRTTPGMTVFSQRLAEFKTGAEIAIAEKAEEQAFIA